MPVQERSKIMMRIADLLESHLDEFAELESRDQGKPIWLAKSVDIPRAVYNFRFFATCSLHDLNRYYCTYVDIQKFNIKYLVIYKVQMHTGAIS